MMNTARRTAVTPADRRIASHNVFSRVSLSLILLTSALAQEPPFKAGVSLIEIDAGVITKRGVIEGLEQADFRIKDNDEPVSVRTCVWEQTSLDIFFGRQRYKLYYDMPMGKPGQTRRVDVGLSASAAALYPDARIIARKGYIMPKGVSAP
jgi:hypothetical protein